MEKNTFWSHIDELRKRLIISFIFIAAGATIGFYFSEDILILLEFPLRTQLQVSLHNPYIRFISSKHIIKLVYITPIEAMWTYIKLGFIAGFVIVFPLVVYEIWLFIKPGLYQNEKKSVRLFVIAAGIFFVIGGAFSFLVILPFAVHFFLSFGGNNLVPMLSVGKYVDFCLKFILSFALIFELPFVILILVATGITSPQALAAKRKYTIVGAFILGAIFSPTPDVFNQTLVAIPLLLLFEVGIIFSRIFVKKKERHKEQIS